METKTMDAMVMDELRIVDAPASDFTEGVFMGIGLAVAVIGLALAAAPLLVVLAG